MSLVESDRIDFWEAAHPVSPISRRRILRAAGFGSLAAATAAVLAACGETPAGTQEEAAASAAAASSMVQVTPPSGPISGTILVDGSSTVGPISQAVAEEFQKQFSDVRVPVGVSGTGGGFKKFCAQETDISDASRFIKSSEAAACDESGIGYIELPVAIDGIAVVVNQQNDWIGDSITTDELRKIWAPESEGQVMTWSQVREGLPDEPLLLYGPGTDSGTYDYFTKAVNGEEGASRGDFTPSEDDNVLVQGVSGDAGAVGFFGLAYYEQNAEILKALKVDGGAGPVFPTTENVFSGKYAPLSRVIFIYVSTVAAERPAVQTFVEFYLKNAASLVGDVGYVPLPAAMYNLALERFTTRKTGTVSAMEGVTDTPNSVLQAWKSGA
ncbi:MAG: PstS family phosphate ABC transporter substrate-binding protein [Chloroflexi bacterium]|nr:PstS family phosphate ABC transporter substrate-binding protein [Chloroflexota bacterium]